VVRFQQNLDDELFGKRKNRRHDRGSNERITRTRGYGLHSKKGVNMGVVHIPVPQVLYMSCLAEIPYFVAKWDLAETFPRAKRSSRGLRTGPPECRLWLPHR
jgi:hypothetical protein